MGWHPWVPRVPASPRLDEDGFQVDSQDSYWNWCQGADTGVHTEAAQGIVRISWYLDYGCWKNNDRGKQLVVGLPYSIESLREIHRRRRLLDKKIWARQPQGAEEIKRRKKWTMRSEFNAYRWKARKEWANQKVTDLQKAEESHDLGAIHRALRETGLCVEKIFGRRSGILLDQCSNHTLGIPLTKSNERPGKIWRLGSRGPDESKIGLAPRRSGNPINDLSNEILCSQHRRDHENTDHCWRRRFLGYGSILDTNTFGVWNTNWEQIVAHIEVCMLYKGKGPRNLSQNQRFILLISFGLRVVARKFQKGFRFTLNPICLLMMNSTG